MIARRSLGSVLETGGAWLLAILWIMPLVYAVWAAFHPPAFATRIDLLAPLTLDNFRAAWNVAPFARYFLNTFMLVTSVLAAQFVLCTLAAYAFARFEFFGREFAFGLVLLQLMIMPEVLIVENYRTMARLDIVDTVLAIGLPYMASAFGIFLLRQTFKTVPKELEEAARVEGASFLQILWKVYVPLARPTYVAYALVSISYHWNNFLWPLVITSGGTWQVLTVATAGLQSRYDAQWTVVMAATTVAILPLLVLFAALSRHVVRSIVVTGLK